LVATAAVESRGTEGKRIMNDVRAAVLPIRRVGGLGTAVSVLVGVVVAMDLVSTWTTWNAYGLVRDYVNRVNAVAAADLDSADDTSSTVGWGYTAVLVAAGVVFVTWLWRARVNAEALCPAPHRRSRGWAVGAWICPVVNLRFPFVFVDDVYRASQPSNPPDLYDLRSVPGNRVLGLWWALWLGSTIIDYLSVVTWRKAASIDTLRTAAVMETIASAAMVGAAVTVIMIVRRISGWQDDRASA
jgi:uncharacterized protein DUF4328